MKMKKRNILLIAPGYGNGGIQSWTNKYVATFSDNEFELTHVKVSKRRSLKGGHKSKLSRSIDGLIDAINVFQNVKRALKNNELDIMHTTTSGSLGTFRDFILSRLCHKYGLKTIMHCRYGCISEDFNNRGFWGWLLRKTMREYDQVWVLDTRSEKALNEDILMRGKVYLTPNSIEVPFVCDLKSKDYSTIAFVGNLAPTKGLYELVEAVIKYDGYIELLIAGPGSPEVIAKIREIAGDKLDKQIKLLGKLSNEDAVRLIENVDIIALPTYYQSEAFPISILEAMSRGKIVISCPRAAISDMLTSVDGSRCGILVREKSVDDIIEAIRWCQENKSAADELCRKAYEKVYAAYRMEVVYEMYRDNYRKLYL